MKSLVESHEHFGYRNVSHGPVNIFVNEQTCEDDLFTDTNHPTEIASLPPSPEYPYITSSRLDLDATRPESPQKRTLRGAVAFTVPSGIPSHRIPGYMLDTLSEFYQNYLVRETDVAIRRDDDRLVIERAHEIRIDIGCQVPFTESVIVFTHASVPQSPRFIDNVSLAASVWAQQHTVAIQENEPHRNGFPHQYDVYLGNPQNAHISSIELAIEQQLQELRRSNPDMTLPEWGEDALPDALDILETSLVNRIPVRALASHVITEKRRQYAISGAMPPISQGDIIQAMARVARYPHD